MYFMERCWDKLNPLTPVAISKLLELIGRSAYILACLLATVPDSNINQTSGSGGHLSMWETRRAGDAAKSGQFIGQFSWVTGDPMGVKGITLWRPLGLKMWHICTKYVTVTFYIQSPDGSIKLSPDFSSNVSKRSSEMFFYVSMKSRLYQDFGFKYTPDWMIWSSKFSKNFWGGAHRAPSPDPSPRSFSGFTLDSGFALKSRALRALDSGFARFGPPNFWTVAAPLYRCI